MEIQRQKKREACMNTVIRVAILGWAAALLTASYAGMLSKMDPTFIATVFTASAATFGINTMKKGDDDDDDKKEDLKREEFVETPPEPVENETVWGQEIQSSVSSDFTLEERVEALETKVDEGDVEEGEGFVRPRRGDL